MLTPADKLQLQKALGQFQNKRILVLGDIGLDEYIDGNISRISPEAPVPVLDVQEEKFHLGLSANVAQNIKCLKGQVDLVSVIGEDFAGKALKEHLNGININTTNLVVDTSRPTTRKLRVMSGQHHVVRVDFEKRRFLSESIEKKVIDQAAPLLKLADGLILQDYAKGVLSENLIQTLIQEAKENHCRVLVDPHRMTPMRFYKNADVITPNKDEALVLSGGEVDGLSTFSLIEIMEILQSKLGSEIIMTRGKEGMNLYSSGTAIHIPTVARQVFDVTGAGDTVVAALSLGLAAGLDMKMSCILANFAAGIVVEKVGCVPCHFEELEASIEKQIDS